MEIPLPLTPHPPIGPEPSLPRPRGRAGGA
jgi:hypothetical protein